VQQPQYDDYGDKYDQYEAAEKSFFVKFKRNKYFPELVKNYSGTPFYKKMFNTCSYLKDFVTRR
jgi:ABC-type microcin C transport system permease subunit YejE